MTTRRYFEVAYRVARSQRASDPVAWALHRVRLRQGRRSRRLKILS
ncbi:MAG: hypothetical protein HKO53_15385 [Gemmatimonadetes bacterium]|nr:hypothetical protein [Gemmatimonadota bacterium]